MSEPFHDSSLSSTAGTNRDSRRVVVVGPCASGKSSLVTALRERGFDARVSGQEHSEIAHLWQRTQPDVLIALRVDIESIRERRSRSWPVWLYDTQLRRLQGAYAAADLTIDTTHSDHLTMISKAVTFLQQSNARRPSVQ